MTHHNTPLLRIRQHLLIAAMTCLFSLLSSSAGEDGFYISVMGGYSLQAEDVTPYGMNIAVDADFPSTFDGGDGALGAIGLGYHLDAFRVEGRIGRHGSKFDGSEDGTGERAGATYVADGKLKSTTFTVEAFYDIDMGASFTPYLKAGIGYVDNEFSTKLGGNGAAPFDEFDGSTDGFYTGYATQSDDGLTWLAGLGLTLEATDNIRIFGEYQYISLGDVQTGQDSFTDGFEIEDAAAHEFLIGARYDF